MDLIKTAFANVQASLDKLDAAVGITPGPTPTPPATATHEADLYLSYGDQNGTATLPLPAEGSPAFWLRADTNSTVIEAAAGTPGQYWEFVINDTIPADAVMMLRLNLYYCALTPTGGGTTTLNIYVTKNGGTLGPFSANLDGLSGVQTIGPITHGGFAPTDKWGIEVITEEVASGALMMTAHASIRW